MKALFKTEIGPGNLALQEIPEPNCGPGEVKLRIRKAGICGSDLHYADGSFPCVPPLVLGHEFSGEIVEVGKGVTRFTIGDRVVAIGSAAHTCGHCEYCWKGEYCFCPERKAVGHGFQGAFSEYLVLREAVVLPIPAKLSLEKAALAEPLACAVHATLEQVAIAPTQSVAIIGPGAMGLLSLAALVNAGCSVLVSGIAGDEPRLAAGRRMGALETVVASEGSALSAAAFEVFGSEKVDVVVECAGAAGSIGLAAEIVKKHGTILQVGLPLKPFLFDYGRIVMQAITIIGSFGHTYSSWTKALALLAKDGFPSQELIGKTFPLTEWREGFRAAQEREAVRILLVP